MSPFEAWQALFRLWGTTVWKPIPQDIQNVLHLKHGIGMYRYNLITRVGANGIDDFIMSMNKTRQGGQS
jgi:hypothetical protein